MSDAQDILRKAADLIATGGWVQGQGETDDGRHCALAAISAAGTNGDELDDINWPGIFAAEKRLRDVVEDYWIAKWNDAPERTAEEVVATLRKAAEATA